ncbi:MAG: cupin domain-containing protein [Paracoccaceae bacterium]
MAITRAGERPTRIAPAEYFTGHVLQDPVVVAPPPARVRALIVQFAPGARTHWHAHALGQTLHVLSGVGRVQEEGGPLREIRPGDTVWIPPEVKHWHGAAPEVAMTHMAIQEVEDRDTQWMEAVAEETAAGPVTG